MSTRNRAADLIPAIEKLPPFLGHMLFIDLGKAEVCLENVFDALESFAETGGCDQATVDAMQWLLDDLRALRRAANDARLS